MRQHLSAVHAGFKATGMLLALRWRMIRSTPRKIAVLVGVSLLMTALTTILGLGPMAFLGGKMGCVGKMRISSPS